MASDIASLNNVQDPSPSAERRGLLRERLVVCAEAAVAAHGLVGLRARELAAGIGCSVGAIYNLVTDLDELALLVAQRTMRDLNACLDDASATDDAGSEVFVALALAYCRFATANRNRWRALFEHRLAPGRDLPTWFEADQIGLFRRLEVRLALRLPNLDAASLGLRARALFSAVHGIVALGLDEKIVAMPVVALEGELAIFVRTYLNGLPSEAWEDAASESRTQRFGSKAIR